MKIREDLVLRNIVSEKVVLLPDSEDGKTRMLHLNSSSAFLWETFAGKEFTVEDVAEALRKEYLLEQSTAESDAAKWVAQLDEVKALE